MELAKKDDRFPIGSSGSASSSLEKKSLNGSSRSLGEVGDALWTTNDGSVVELSGDAPDTLADCGDSFVVGFPFEGPGFENFLCPYR